MSQFLTAALYKFVALPDYVQLQGPLQAVCESYQVKGTVLLASEGINGTIAGPEAGVRAVLAHLRADARFADLQAKEAWANSPPFLRLKIRLKKEIVTLGVPGVSPTLMAGQYVKPQDWNSLISDPDVVLVDTRNDYEVAIGTFKGAIDPRIKTFADLPAWVAQQEQAGGALAADGAKKPRVAMFCTGGIRCEKSTALLRMHGYGEVYHLEGGILKYLETVPAENSLWQGECFVFDERVSVGHGLTPGPYELCRSCRHPVGEAERASPEYTQGVCCPHCAGLKTEAQKQGFAERQRQVDLARLRGQPHVGAKMPQKPKRLADPLAHLLDLLHAQAANPPSTRLLIALAGLPGSGKSTMAARLAQDVNARAGSAVAMALGMDGFHLTKAQLAGFSDPVAALTRRGAPWTFDPQGLGRQLQMLRAGWTSGQTVAWPGFEHGTGDPVANLHSVDQAIRLVIIEGLYLLKEGDGWHLPALFDELWYLDVPMAVAMDRLVKRHMAANGNTREQAEHRLNLNDRLNAGIVRQTRARADWLMLYI